MNVPQTVQALLCVLVLGCMGCGSGGPARYKISGTATYDDKPILVGTLIFNADNKAGNSGPQGRADIRDGKIAMQSGMGCVGGPQWIQISGYDGKEYVGNEGKKIEYGKPLFAMAHKQIELPRRDAEISIRVVSKGKDAEPEVQIGVTR